ncbi:REP-associated tyrosine transposase [Aeoliella sp.]|uniref:REP-associated tyrosine transposase n=1 Tax=Aeoliella sp. TaxID=2795800 RepID=UPI003CCB892F
MPNYRRRYVPGGTYFFTAVTHERRQLFLHESARRLLRCAIETVQESYPFHMFAVCLLPDHLHCVWTLPEGDTNYSMRWRRIKDEFTTQWVARRGEEGIRSESRLAKKERGIWQRRYWEHAVVDEDDLKRCVDYIHWNPRKHGLVENVKDWTWSSFHRFVAAGEYEADWGRANPTPDWDDPEWGGVRKRDRRRMGQGA